MFADMFRAADIPHSQLAVLMMLSHQGACRSCDIGRELKVSAPTTTGIISRLQRAGLVKRQPSAQDRRGVTVSLTQKGQELALRLRGIIVDRWAGLLSKIPKNDAEQYLEILKKISEAV